MDFIWEKLKTLYKRYKTYKRDIIMFKFKFYNLLMKHIAQSASFVHVCVHFVWEVLSNTSLISFGNPKSFLGPFFYFVFVLST